MKKAKEYRQAAWENLRGKWGTMALATFVYTLIMVACGILSIIYIGSIAALLLTGAFLLGLAAMALKVCKNEEVHTGDLFCGFEQFGSSLALYLLGGGVIHDFALTMLIGVFVGTASSIYVSSAVLLALGDTEFYVHQQERPVYEKPGEHGIV